MKKKSVFNNNEVDIDLLFNQPKHLKKMFGKNKDKEELGEEDDEDEEDDNESSHRSLTPQMKKYINDYIDSKKVNTNSRKEGIVEGTLDKLDERYKSFTDDMEEKRANNAAEHKGKGIIENYLKKRLNKK